MSKRTIIIAVLAVLLFCAALLSCSYDFKNKEPEPEPDQEPEPAPEPEKEKEPETELIPDLKPEP